MGAGAAKPVKNEVHLDCEPSHTNITSNETNTKVIKVQKVCDVLDNTVVSDQKLDLKKIKVEISCTGGGVLRIGLTTTDPSENKDILRGSVFEKEEGFGYHETTRILYKSDFNYCFGQRDAEREYKCEKKDTNLWLYVIYVFGLPDVNATQVEKDSEGVEEIRFSPLAADQKILSPNTAVCKIREPVLTGEVYHCHWNMMLENEAIAGTPPIYGYMRLKLVSRSNEKEEVTIWERASAVLEYPFSSVIAFCLSVRERSVSHNLLVNSVDHTKKGHFEDNVGSNNLFFEIEFSSGQIGVTHAKNALIRQDPGSILLVTNYKSEEEDNYHLLLEIAAKTDHRPKHLQFGDSPVIFILEFNERLTDKEISDLKDELGCQVKSVKETDTVQVIIDDLEANENDDKKFEIEQYFSREKAGGGEINNMEKDADIPGCWTIRYKKTKIARNIWMMNIHNFAIEESHVHARVFPVYNGLGLAVNNGEKPKYDTSLLEVEVDKGKLRFVFNREPEKKAFTAKIKQRIEVSVIWAACSNRNDTDEFEENTESEDEEEEPKSITFECCVPESEGKKLAIWKDITKKYVLEYFSRSIHEVQFQVGDDVIENVEDVLQNLQGKNDFEYEENLMSNQIKLFGSDNKMLKEVADKAGTPIVIEETVTEKVEVALEKYLALDTEGILDDVKRDCSFTSFKVDREKGIVSLKGPKKEVHEGKVKILKLAIHIKTVEIALQKEHVEFLKRSGHNLLEKRFRDKKMNHNFTVAEGRLDVMIFTGGNTNEGKKIREMLAVVNNLIQSCTVPVDKESVPMLQSYEWKTFKNEIETSSDGPVFISEPQNKNAINIIGTIETVKFAKTKVANYFKCHGVGKSMFRVSIEVAEYLDEFNSKEYQDNLECVKDSNGCYTGELSIRGSVQEVGRLKDTVEKDSKKVNIHWFAIEKTWIASVIQDLVDLKTLSHNEKFMLQVDIGHSLAAQGITSVAVFKKTGTVIQVRQGDITLETTNVIVNNTDGHEKSLNKGLARQLVELGGEDIKDELLREIKNRKATLEAKYRERKNVIEVENQEMSEDSTVTKETVQEEDHGFKAGEVIMTSSGRLRCVKVMHAFCPKWIDGNKSEERDMKNLITNILQLCQAKGLTSIAIPAISCGGGKYPVDKATSHIVEAVTEFIENTKGVAIKEVILCDSSKQAVDKFTDALDSLKNQWFVFKHGKEIQVEDLITSLNRKTGHQMAVGPDSGHKTIGPPIARPKTATLRWGRQRQQQHTIIHEGQADQQVNQTEPQVDEDFKDGLPFNISITDTFTLHVKKGDLTKQTANVIVSTTPDFPDIKGEVAKAILEAGGDSILQECTSLGKITEGQLKATGPGRLNCDRIYHAVIPMKWNPITGQDFVYKLVSSCLKEANKSGYSKVAFPTIGTGRSGFPPDKVANSMIKAICETGKETSFLTDVTIIVYSAAEGVCKVFETVVPLLFKSSSKDATPGRAGNVAKVHQRRKSAKYVQPPSFGKHTHVDDVVIVKVVSQTDGKTIQGKLEGIVEKQFVTKSLNFEELSKEQTLREDEQSALKTLEMLHGMNVEIDQKKKCVKLMGLKKRVDACEFEAIKLLQDEFPTWRLKARNVRTVAASVQWYYSGDDGKTYPVDEESNYEIHVNYLRGDDFIYHNTKENKKYKMIRGDMSEHPIDDPTKRRGLYLRTNTDKEDIGLPDNWSIKEKGGDVAEITLNENEAEFNEVKDQFIKDGCKAGKIVSIQRLEHRFMWKQFQTKKKQLGIQNPQIQNERRLWHGTNIDTVPKIIKNGYDRNFAGNANMTALGKGVYFAASSAYSNRDQYAARDAHGNKRMFWNRVLTGVPCRGSQDMPTLPPRQGIVQNTFPVYYDSAVDDVQNPGIVVIFHDTQVYPEYLITYTV